MVVRATAEVVVEKKVCTDFTIETVDLKLLYHRNTHDLQERKLGPLERGGTLSGNQAAGKARSRLNC